MRTLAIAALVIVAVSAGTIAPWEAEPLEALDPINFTVTNCGDPNTDYFVIHKAELKNPMPIHSGDTLIGSFEASLVNDIHAASGSLLIEKQMSASQWVKIPCLGEIGSCTYNDLCAQLTQLPNEECQKYFHQDCQCPVKSTEIKYDNVKVNVPKIPSMLKGNFRVTIQATETSTQKRIACYVVTASIA